MPAIRRRSLRRYVGRLWPQDVPPGLRRPGSPYASPRPPVLPQRRHGHLGRRRVIGVRTGLRSLPHIIRYPDVTNLRWHVPTVPAVPANLYPQPRVRVSTSQIYEHAALPQYAQSNRRTFGRKPSLVREMACRYVRNVQSRPESSHMTESDRGMVPSDRPRPGLPLERRAAWPGRCSSGQAQAQEHARDRGDTRPRPAPLLSLAALLHAPTINAAARTEPGGYQCRGQVTAGRTETYRAV